MHGIWIVLLIVGTADRTRNEVIYFQAPHPLAFQGCERALLYVEFVGIDKVLFHPGCLRASCPQFVRRRAPGIDKTYYLTKVK